MASLFARIKGTDARTALVRKNILFSFLIKGWSALVMLLLVPITLRCLGDYTNGVWLTISSMLVWIDQMDIGLGRGLQNKLAAALAKEDYKEARRVVSNTFFMLVLIIVPIFLILLATVNISDIYAFLNVDEAAVPGLYNTLSIALLLVCSTFIFKFIGNFYMGLQLPAVNNMLVTISQTIILAATCIAYFTGAHSLMIIAVINTACPLLTFLCAYPYSFYKKYRKLAPTLSDFNWRISKSLFTMGTKFFILQISGAILFFTSNILISKILSPAEVTPYQIVYRYFTVITIIFAVISTPYWSATTDAYERGDFEWIENSRRKMNKVMAMLFALVGIMTIASPLVFYIWIGDKTEITFTLTVCEALYVIVLNGSLSFSYFINGTGKLHLQMILTALAAVLFIPLAYLLTSLWHDVNCIILLMTGLILPNLVCNAIQFHKIVSRTATGIWNK